MDNKNGVQCPICNSEFKEFLPFGLRPRNNAMCPVCGSLERHRLITVYMNEQTNLLDGREKRLLHFAPEKCLFNLYKGMDNIDYYPCDLDANHYCNNNTYAIKADITDIPFRDDYFDVIVANHVLEHIVDDRLAMRELFRVLKPGGWAILMVPIKYALAETYEDFTVTNPLEREKAFGQDDHVRCYGRDYADRLRSVGFSLDEWDWTNEYPPNLAKQYSFLDLEPIVYCAKKDIA